MHVSVRCCGCIPLHLCHMYHQSDAGDFYVVVATISSNRDDVITMHKKKKPIIKVKYYHYMVL